MKTNLYIDNQLCSSLADLKQHFLELSSGSNTYLDLLDYSRHGDLIDWLKEENENELADRLHFIDQSLGDSEYMTQVLKVFITSDDRVRVFDKPDFSSCVNFQVSNKTLTHNSLMVEISLEIMLAVNECYEVVVKTEWGNKGFTFNPSKYEESSIRKFSYTFYKRTGIEIERLIIFVDDDIILDEPIEMLMKTNSSQQLETLEGEPTSKEKMTAAIQHIASTLIGVIQESEIMRKETANNSIQQPILFHSNQETKPLSQPTVKKYSWQTPGYYAVIEKDRKEREEWERCIRERQQTKEQEEQAEADRLSLEKWKRRHGIK